MVKEDKERIMRDLGKLFYGKKEELFSLEKFMQSIKTAPEAKGRLIRGRSDE
ncbi:MAG TPA: hypothetical protein VMV49_03435 [Candidatus Deferrimicrobium sp.]|nr:hypothetical protein [Candidatus Deferrimicrobium sp.]